jgi:hypothetical protein
MYVVGHKVAGRYQLARLLGQGGMGSVFEARDVRSGDSCAVKLLNPDSAWNPESVRRFYREARAATAIGHPAIVQVRDVGRDDDGTPFIVMEYLPGESLAARIKRLGALPAEQAIVVIIQVLSGLEEAHRVGIVHRDVKPDNIHLLGPEGKPVAKLLDFGVSRFRMVDSSMNTKLTRTGTVIGTANYMAPEQARGDLDLDHRIDVFAAGAVLYEATTGVVAFDGANYNQVMAHVLAADFRRPTEVVPEFPAALESVICKAMAFYREDRYATAADMIAGLVPLLQDPQVVGSFAPRPVGLRRRIAVRTASVAATVSAILTTRPRRAGAALAAVLLLVVAGIAWAVWPSPADSPRRNEALPAEPPTTSRPVPEAAGTAPLSVDVVASDGSTAPLRPAGAGTATTVELQTAVDAGPAETADASSPLLPPADAAAGPDAAPSSDIAQPDDAAARRPPDARRRDAGRLGITHETPF